MKKLILILGLTLLMAFNVKAASYTTSEIDPSTYVIGKYMFTRSINEETGYDGVLTTRRIMLAAKSIEGNQEEDMVIYYKTSRGQWIDALSGESVEVEEEIPITKVDLEGINFTVTFETDGGTQIESQSIEENGVVTRPSNPVKKGWAFVEWRLNGSSYDFSTPVTSDITLTAMYALPTYTTFTNGEFFMHCYTKTSYDNKTYVTATSIAPGDKIVCVTGFEVGSNKMVDEYQFDLTWGTGLTLLSHASSSETAISYVGTTTHHYTVTETTPTAVTEYGVAFTFEVSTVADANQLFVGMNNIKFITSTSDYYSMGSYNKGFVVTKYTVTIKDDMNGSIISTQQVTYGQTATKPADPTRAGYKFIGWADNLGNDYKFTESVTADIVVHAEWEEQVYQVAIRAIDQFSPDRTLVVLLNGEEIEFSEIRYDGFTLCTGSNPTANFNDLAGITSFDVVLPDDSIVTATLVG